MIKNNLRILCIHQGFELYGSDRSFILTVSLLRKEFPHSNIHIVIPQNGPIVPHLEKICNKISIENIGILRKQELVSNPVSFFFHIIRSVLSARKRMKNADLVYINTTVVIDHIIATRLCETKSIIHIREIPQNVFMYIFFSLLLRFSPAMKIFNSKATAKSYWLPRKQNSNILYNAVQPVIFNQKIKPQSDKTIHILLLGRFNSWKGQGLLVEAVHLLPDEIRTQIKVKLAGSTFGGQTKYTDSANNLIMQYQLSSVISIEGFQENTGSLYSWSDIVIVPSLKPEPFGLVAIEAMSAGRAIIAAGHGGLTEIIENGISGLLFIPGSARDLANCIKILVSDRNRLIEISNNGKKRYEKVFTPDIYKDNLIHLINSFIKLN